MQKWEEIQKVAENLDVGRITLGDKEKKLIKWS